MNHTNLAALDAIETDLWLTCDALLMHHTNPWELDEALVAWGFQTGPCEMQDHVGLFHVLDRFGGRGSPILPRMVSEGRMGKIGGVGFYRYPGGGGAVIDPLIEDLILEEAWFAKTHRSALTDAQIASRVAGALRTCLDTHSANLDDISMRLRLPAKVLENL